MITRKNNDLWFVTFIDICNINSTNKDCIRKTIVGWWYKPQGEGDNFNEEGKGLPLCNCVVLKLYCFSVYCKRFYRITLFPIFLLWYLFCIYWDWQRQKGNLKYTKVYEITSELHCYWNLCFSHFCNTNTFTYNLTRINLFQLEICNIWIKIFWSPQDFLFRHTKFLTLNS